jgi:hypothetical protein
MVAPQFRHEYLRLPALAVFSMHSPHSGHAFWSCLMFLESMSVIAILRQLRRTILSKGWWWVRVLPPPDGG